ncbi:HyaD/HybD family hydrogenase maturation endopeptidase [Helicobacter baculiformis]|uniref:HyaD/HybD family hydrogenase maturation endopeptidase n=1 Tax=Helicobacter baculiformis TaxID=427351 RepID=A0ABV7ZGD5_9HELI|nr:HyaD/HybD family hydrogenase maturation endopeptidase [Helicobacter baculiformis]
MDILVLGVGNILLGDEGVGVHLCHQLKCSYHFTHKGKLTFMDGGTMAQALIPWIVEYDRILILDCVSVVGAQVGALYCFDFDQIPAEITWAGSAHEVEMLQTLKLTALMGDLPLTTIIGLVPAIMQDRTTFELSPDLLQGARLAKEHALKILAQWGVRATLKAKAQDLQQIAYQSYRRALS